MVMCSALASVWNREERDAETKGNAILDGNVPITLKTGRLSVRVRAVVSELHHGTVPVFRVPLVRPSGPRQEHDPYCP